MRKIQAQPLTPTSWILTEWGNRIGVLCCDDHAWSVLGPKINGEAASVEILEEVLGCEFVFEEPADLVQKPTTEVHGLPIKHPQAHNIEQLPRVTYTKSERGGTRYAAGYWAIQFANGWSGSLCPKVTTLEEYPHQGPFSQKLELNSVLNKHKRGSKL